MRPRPVPDTNVIEAYVHCALCVREVPPGTAPADWARLEVGWTRLGLQVWCRRHDANVLHIDFEGRRHPAATTRRR